MKQAEVDFRRSVQAHMEDMISADSKIHPDDVVLQTAIDFQLPEVLLFDGRSWLWARERQAERELIAAWDYVSLFEL